MPGAARRAAYVLLTTVTAAAGATALLHLALAPGTLPCCSLPAYAEILIPLAVGIAAGVPVAMFAGRGGSRRPDGSAPCPSCGAPVMETWRLCPQCGYIMGGEGIQAPEAHGPRG